MVCSITSTSSSHKSAKYPIFADLEEGLKRTDTERERDLCGKECILIVLATGAMLFVLPNCTASMMPKQKALAHMHVALRHFTYWNAHPDAQSNGDPEKLDLDSGFLMRVMQSCLPALIL